ncbi:MAG: VOC family protein [Burkholderiaceae bacterium]|nr:VOC family protein [Burkholderiaceae bacterium]
MSAPRIDHIGIIVDELEPAIAAMARMLPGAPLRRRSIPDAGLEVAEFEAANLIVELLCYTDRGDGFGRAVMGTTAGVNHLSLGVPDLDAALAALQAGGVEPMTGFPRRGAHGRVAFLPREPHTGLLFELCQPDDGQPTGEAST